MKKSYQTPEMAVSKFSLLSNILLEPEGESGLNTGGGDLFNGNSAGSPSYDLETYSDIVGFGW